MGVEESTRSEPLEPAQESVEQAEELAGSSGSEPVQEIVASMGLRQEQQVSERQESRSASELSTLVQ